jgi:hypothetical protein
MQRATIVGTAQSWTMAPWNDPGMYIVSLNDAYRMKGFVRADAWYDLHPLDKFYAPVEGALLYAHQVPAGCYARPADHKAWLASQQIPVWLHPDHATQDPASAAWPTARAFPWADVKDTFTDYFTSSPAEIMAHLMLQGATEIHIYGIHLATESEYIHQRPQMEMIAGRFLGRGKCTKTTKNGLRYYESPDALLVFPEASPVLQADWVYAIEPKPHDGHKEQLKWEHHKYSIKRERAIGALKAKPFWQRSKPLQEALWLHEAQLADVQDALQRVDLAQHWR